MGKILIILFILMYYNLQSQEYKQPTQYYYQSETKDISYLALIGGNVAFITMGNLIDQRMSGLTPNKNQHMNLFISIIVCGGIDYLYLSSKFRNRKSNKRKKKTKNL